MGDKSAIQWTDATLNIVTGCTRVSAGCDHCYAFQLHDQRHLAWKRGTMPDAAPQYHKPFSQVQLFPERLKIPARWQKPRRIFVCSMGDLFHPDVPNDFIYEAFSMMWNAPWHTFQVLTKRPERVVALMNNEGDADWPTRSTIGDFHRDNFPNVWIGTSVEDQSAANARLNFLTAVPAAVRFVSAEPLLGPLDLRLWLHRPGTRRFSRESREVAPDETLEWIIVGGESGPHARPLNLVWIRSILDQVRGGGAKVFVKQLGSVWAKANGAKDRHGGDMAEWPEDLQVRAFPETAVSQ